jgi:UDP-N-acetylglucosamine 2-epimerase
MDKTACLVGNSSSGIREGVFIGTPVVNIGSRQQGRQHGNNVITVGYNREEIRKAILKQLKHGKYKREYMYGDGNASKKIVKILRDTEVSPQKKLHY